MKLKLFKFLLPMFLFNLNNFVFSSENTVNNLSSSNIQNETDLNLNKNFYLLGPGDILNLKLFGAPEFSGEYKILNDGTVTFPLIGNIKINNLSINNASNLIKKLYSDELLNPDLFLTIVFTRPIRVSVVGEVQRPGLYSLTTDEFTQTVGGSQIKNSGLPRVVDAIQKSGGITQDANLTEVFLRRRIEGDKALYKETKINLAELIFEGRHNQNPFLFDGDVIEIGKAKVIDNNLFNIAESNLSPKIIDISIIGEVENPGKYQVMANTPLNAAILQAGGPKLWKANRGDIQLFRINRDGTLIRKKLRINLNKGISSKYNPPLKNGDVISVNKSALSKVSTGLNVVAEPMRDLVTGLTLFRLFND